MSADKAPAGPGFAVYVHWPFCETICPYCDFNVHPAGDVDIQVWTDALLGDLRTYAAETPGRTVTSLYFGGGTPSLLSPSAVQKLIDGTAGLWPMAADAEITIEVNPTSGEAARLAAFRRAGVNRVSVGVQSLDDAALRFLGRTHRAAEGRAALARAVEIFERVTFDLMYALPGQTLEEWRRALTEAVGFGTGHLSLYQLTIESGTPFMKDGVVPADDDTAADLYDITQDILGAAGLSAYEVSNHARPGDESRHNLTCWRGGDYIGAGPGAHGRVSIGGQTFGTHQIHNPARWLEKVGEVGHGTAKRRPLGAADRARERIMMGLRLSEGIDPAAIAEDTGCAAAALFDDAARTRLIEGGLLRQDGRRLIATADGRLKLNGVLRALLAPVEG